jgi:hypothetical protein
MAELTCEERSTGTKIAHEAVQSAELAISIQMSKEKRNDLPTGKSRSSDTRRCPARTPSATGAGWAEYQNLKNSPATAISSASASAAIVPGYPGKLGKPWRIFLVWKNSGTANTLWETSYDL